jgi:TerC family integral membrane protein
MIFQYFATPAEYQHRVLFWGILGALILRAIFIATGAALIGNFHWMIYIFGAFLVFTGIKMFLQGDEKIEPGKNPLVRLFERCVPVSKKYHGQSFFVRHEGRRQATLLMVVLIVIETTDVIFAVDSIPAIFAITQDPFIVYTSNVFAILGLRALYFMLAGVMQMFIYLKVGLSFVLGFVGAKMLLVDLYKIPIGASLSVIGGVLLLSILASWWVQRKPTPAHGPRPALVWPAVALAGIILILVKWHSIAAGPTGHEAITVLRVVERELADAQWRQPTLISAEIFRHANAALDEAWTDLGEKRYEEAIATAQAAKEILAERPR